MTSLKVAGFFIRTWEKQTEHTSTKTTVKAKKDDEKDKAGRIARTQKHTFSSFVAKYYQRRKETAAFMNTQPEAYAHAFLYFVMYNYTQCYLTNI